MGDVPECRRCGDTGCVCGGIGLTCSGCCPECGDGLHVSATTRPGYEPGPEDQRAFAAAVADMRRRLRRRRLAVPPNDGGCWYCHRIDGEMVFSWEFDCWMHLQCLEARLSEQPDDEEARVFQREFEEALSALSPEGRGSESGGDPS